MKKLGIAFLIYLGLVSAALAQNTQVTPAFCNKTFSVSQGAVALTKVVSGTANKSIQLCGWAISAGAATGTAELSTGTGTNCGTGTASVQPVRSLPINGGFVDHIPFVNQVLPVGNDLCLVTTGTGPTSVTIYYSQF